VRLRVIGVGSPHGDDAVGLAVAERMAREELPPGVEVVARSRPGLDLLDDLRGVDGVVLVDAICGEGPPGAVRGVDPEQLAPGRGSSHAQGVAEALSLAAALGCRPARLRIVGIDVGSEAGVSPGAPLSHAVRTAVAAACLRVHSELREMRRTPHAAGDR
jgi:hydrogenase maturation protease